ncbi:hypothetical protein WAE58_21700 [Pedobacter panaciterrae]|uniref:DUF4199 domain-containing protein n=1 Tax=Pedobacter panaciterrae TaxID=363849 RepID=A0ABU8NS36_9SPHI
MAKISIKIKPIIILALLNISLWLCFGGVLMFVLSSKSDTIALTNVGFAMFIGLSSVLFNWARALDAKHYKEEIDEINHYSSLGILGSIFFIMSSSLKYFSDPDKLSSKSIDFEFNISSIMYHIVANIFLVVAMVLALFVILAVFENFYNISMKKWKLHNSEMKTPEKKTQV